MLVNLLGLLLLFLLTLLFAWLVVRTLRYNQSRLKWPALIATGLLTLLVGLMTILAGKGLYTFYVPRSIPVPQVSIESSANQITRGEHITSYLCAHCHTTNNQLPLSGGTDIAVRSAVPIGSLVPFNLTPGGPLKAWSDGEIFRAVRMGVDREGHPLIAMSNLSTRTLSDDDIQAVIAYLRRQPAVDDQIAGGDHPNLLFALFVGSGLVPQPTPVVGVVVAPARGSTAEYGKYMVGYTGCRDCHGPDLAGGKSGGLSPVGPSLRPAGAWNQEQFIHTIRTGTTPGGHSLDNEKMFWKDFALMDNVELTAIHAYLSSLIVSQGQP